MYSRLFLFFISILLYQCKSAPQSASVHPKATVTENANSSYRAAYTSKFDLIHTKMEIKPDFKSRTVKGLATISLHPHFYPADTLVLSAHQMIIIGVSIIDSVHTTEYKHDLHYENTGSELKISLGRKYSKDETVLVQIDYIGQPEKVLPDGSAAIKSNSGFFFIDPDSIDERQPTQFWTQGETESNSSWFPTIESPQQKMTQEIYLTVDTAFTTLSNGLLLSSVTNADGTRTDYWKQSLPVAPYLTMVGAGKFSKVTDHWRNISVDYYTDPEYAPYAKMTFGNTPEMIEYFSKCLGVDYPWEKYAQVVVHQFISGAMENTTAVVQGENIQQDPREFKDRNYEDYIAHELFHHWFGDLVTCKSWSNITLNEGFAAYGEYLWFDHKYGREQADYWGMRALGSYLNYANEKDAPLIRYEYKHREELFNPISYKKGARVLHMLRKYVGDDAFFASVNYYLTTNSYSFVEIKDLQKAFEKITGQDLNWFFGQWFLREGYPILDIAYDWNDADKKINIKIEQKQNLDSVQLFKLPLDVDFYIGGKVQHQRIVCEKASETFSFSFPARPDLVNVDAEKMLICKKVDHKSNPELIFQYLHAPLYSDRYEALYKLGKDYAIGSAEADVIIEALHDPFWNLRVVAISNIGELAKNSPERPKPELVHLMKHDSSSAVREAAVLALGKYYPYEETTMLLDEALKDSSYEVEAEAFNQISRKDRAKAQAISGKLEADTGNAVMLILSSFYKDTNVGHLDFYKKAYTCTSPSTTYKVVRNFGKYLQSVEDLDEFENGATFLLHKNKLLNAGYLKNQVRTTIAELLDLNISRISKLEDLNKEGKITSAQVKELNDYKIVQAHLDKLARE